MNIQADHVYLLVKVPPEVSILILMDTVKGETALQLFRQLLYLKEKSYWENHFWARGYCVDTVGVDAEMIRIPRANSNDLFRSLISAISKNK